MKPPFVFVHGAFCGGWAFEQFVVPFEAMGLETHTPDLPDHGPRPDLDRLARRGVRCYAEAVADYCQKLKTPPVLVGHSLGGLVCQVAAMRIEVAALVLLAPSAPWGVMPTTLDEHGSNLGLTLMGDYWRRAILPDETVARHATLDRLSYDAARQTFTKFVPESGKAVLEAVQWWLDPERGSAVPVERIKAPVLAVAGSRDRVNPPTTVRRVADRFPKSQADFLEMRGMSHWLVGEPESADVADTILRWLYGREIVAAKAPRSSTRRRKLAGVSETALG